MGWLNWFDKEENGINENQWVYVQNNRSSLLPSSSSDPLSVSPLFPSLGRRNLGGDQEMPFLNSSNLISFTNSLHLPHSLLFSLSPSTECQVDGRPPWSGIGAAPPPAVTINGESNSLPNSLSAHLPLPSISLLALSSYLPKPCWVFRQAAGLTTAGHSRGGGGAT